MAAVPETVAMTVSNLSSRMLRISLASCLTCFLLFLAQPPPNLPVLLL